MPKTRITIVKLPRKDRPYHHAVCGPGAESLKFTTRRKAELYASLRKQCKTQGLALGEFEQRFPLGTAKLECAPVADGSPATAPKDKQVSTDFTERSIREMWNHLHAQAADIEALNATLRKTQEKVFKLESAAQAPDPVKTCGQIAFESFKLALGQRSEWGDIHPENQKAWEAAGEAVSAAAIKDVAQAAEPGNVYPPPIREAQRRP